MLNDKWENKVNGLKGLKGYHFKYDGQRIFINRCNLSKDLKEMREWTCEEQSRQKEESVWRSYGRHEEELGDWSQVHKINAY